MLFVIEKSTHEHTLEEFLIVQFCKFFQDSKDPQDKLEKKNENKNKNKQNNEQDNNGPHSYLICDEFPVSKEETSKSASASASPSASAKPFDSMKNIVPIGSVTWCLQKYQSFSVPNYYPDMFRDFYHRLIKKVSLEQLLNDKVFMSATKHIFVKPADTYKLFPGTICSLDKLKQIHEKFGNIQVYCSEIIPIVNEFRLYVSKGQIISQAWYDGIISDEEIIAKNMYPNVPELPQKLLEIIKDNKYSGILDIAEVVSKSDADKDTEIKSTTDNDRSDNDKSDKNTEDKNTNNIVVIEACPPFAFGWYNQEETIENSLLYGNFMIDSDAFLQSQNDKCNKMKNLTEKN